MSGVTKIEIRESIEELAQRLSAETNPKLKERLQALYLLKLPKAMTVSAVAKVIGKHRGTLQRWLSVYQDRGLGLFLEIKEVTGRPKVIPPWVVVSLQQRLNEPEGFKSYGQVQQWLKDTLGVEARYHTVHHLVRYRLKAKLKAVRPVHLKQDPVQREAFKKTLSATSTC